MGQYYLATAMRKDNSAPIKIFESLDYDTGMKLMEHSYIGNDYVEAVMEFIRRIGPCRLVWCGDYAADFLTRNEFPNKDWDLSKQPVDRQTKFILNLWKENPVMAPESKRCEDKYDIEKYDLEKYDWKTPFYGRIKYIHNVTKNVWIDLEQYIIKKSLDIHPLPLLTALGNGEGGGDYDGAYMEFIGDWAGDVIECFYPDDMTECTAGTKMDTYTFKMCGKQYKDIFFIKYEFEENRR